MGARATRQRELVDITSALERHVMQHTIIIEGNNIGETLEESERLSLRGSEEVSEYVQHPPMSSVSAE